MFLCGTLVLSPGKHETSAGSKKSLTHLILKSKNLRLISKHLLRVITRVTLRLLTVQL